MAKFIPRIGLEIHIELLTKTKMFCGCLNDSNEKHPNVNVCPVCMGYPGVLPVINKEAVKSVLRTGLALGGSLADYTRFDRKNYFYPDLPKGYQISQYKFPLVKGGTLNGVRIRRIHLEEDTGRLIHHQKFSLIDFNRCGVPLMELVTEPDISSAEEARRFAEELRLVLRYLNVSEGDMEKGQMRIEANISLASSKGLNTEFQPELGTKVEIKNLNSFKAVELAIKYEIQRQSRVLNEGKFVVQETRGWNEFKKRTFSQRQKEEAHDYRYFPEPDLPPLRISKVKDFENLKETIPELPFEKRERFKKEYKLKDEIINILVNERRFAEFFEEVVSEIKADKKKSANGKDIELAANYLTSDLVGLMKEKYLNFEELRVNPENFADLINMILEGKISSRVAKDVLRKMVETGIEPHILIKEKGLEQISDEGVIEDIARKVIADNPKAVEDYKEGKKSALEFLLGALMRETKGKSNPLKAKEILNRLLS